VNSLSLWQKIFKVIASKDTFTAMEAESRTWTIQCENCRCERTIWEIGGIRWKAAGSPRMYRACPNCGQKQWHTVYKKTT
jgi:hypothetical protein